MAQPSKDVPAATSSWNPGRTHWWTTTAIAVAAAVLSSVSALLNVFYHPGAPPVTIDSAHAEFMKLSYADRLDRCQPYIANRADAWQQAWRTQLASAGGSRLREPIAYAPLDEVNAPGQAIVNTLLAVQNYAEKHAPFDEGANLLSCVFTPSLKMGDPARPPDVQSLVGSDNDAPKADNVVIQESALYSQGEFAAVRAEGRPSKIVEVLIRPGPAATHREMGLVMVSGHDQGVRMWALTASVDQGQSGWMNDVQGYKGF